MYDHLPLENIDGNSLIDMYYSRREEKNIAWYMGMKEIYKIGHLRDGMGQYLMDSTLYGINPKLFGLNIIILGDTADVYLGNDPLYECPQCYTTSAPYPETGNCPGCGVNRVKQ